MNLLPGISMDAVLDRPKEYAVLRSAVRKFEAACWYARQNTEFNPGSKSYYNQILYSRSFGMYGSVFGWKVLVYSQAARTVLTAIDIKTGDWLSLTATSPERSVVSDLRFQHTSLSFEEAAKWLTSLSDYGPVQLHPDPSIGPPYV